MTSHIKSEFCWFSAACLALTGLVLVFTAVDADASLQSARLETLLVAGAAGAFVLMALVMALAWRLDHEGEDSPEAPSPRSPTAHRH